MRYITSVTDYATPDTVQALLYDSGRQQLYMNAGDHIDVFSLVSNSFGTPITPPSLGGTLQLQGMALTPDNSKLIVGNFSDDSASLIDPDNPTAAIAVQIAPLLGAGSLPEGPNTVATTSLGTAFMNVGTTLQVNGGGGWVYELDLTTLKSTLATNGPGIPRISGGPMSQSPDGTEVSLVVPNENGGMVMSWSATTDSWLTQSLGGFLTDTATARDGNVTAVNHDAGFSDFPYPMLLDSQLRQISQFGIESLLAAVNLPGMAVHDSGALLYSTTDLGVDIIDVNHGQLAERVVFNEEGLGIPGSLAVDQSGGKIFLLTVAGLTIVQLDAVPLSVGSVTPSTVNPGMVFQIRGSGFQAGTTAKLNGNSAAVGYIDADTLQITVPTLGSGPATLVLGNPDGTSYNMEGAVSVQ